MLSPGIQVCLVCREGPWRAVSAPSLASEPLEGRDQGLAVSRSLCTGHAEL